jgi:3-keto-disaccharide hydrolase
MPLAAADTDAVPSRAFHTLKTIMHRQTLHVVVSISFMAAVLSASIAQERQLFNGKDLDGWEGNPESWSVQDGAITGITTDDKRLPYNQFLIWRGGKVKNFELRAKVRQTGNNSGIQYRSKELQQVGPWSVGGYQCDIHPQSANNAMLYDERGRGIVAQNGQTVIIDRDGTKWLVKETEPVKVDVSEWNEYTIIARGNHLIHKLNGQVTADVIDHQEGERDLEGIVAIQIHQGPAMKVQVKDIVLRELPDGEVLTPEQAPVPADAKKVAPPAGGKKKKADASAK